MQQRRLSAAIVTFAFLIAFTSASADTRDELIDQIMDAAGKPPPVVPGSDDVTKTLNAAKLANPGVDQTTWDAVRIETAAALSKINSGPESPFALRYRAALADFSDPELQDVLAALRNPLLIKLRGSLRSHSDVYKKSFMPNVLRVNSDVSQILIRHGLKPVGP